MMIKNILITGAKGQLAREFQVLVEDEDYNIEDATFYFTDKDALDITDKQELLDFIEMNAIDTVINCAAYTAVDKAEDDEVLALKVNAEAVGNLASISKENNIFLIHISTDYVFDGNGDRPYQEEDQTNPQGKYGITKLRGEELLKEINPPHAIIIRTAWVYSEFGNNFLNTMLRIGKERSEINVVCDQLGAPTYAKDLARSILTMLHQETQFRTTQTTDTVVTYHYSNEGSCSWYDFAQAIFKLANIECKVNPISTEEYPTPAKRPHYSVLDKTKIKEAYGLVIPHWDDALKSCIENMDVMK